VPHRQSSCGKVFRERHPAGPECPSAVRRCSGQQPPVRDSTAARLSWHRRHRGFLPKPVGFRCEGPARVGPALAGAADLPLGPFARSKWTGRSATAHRSLDPVLIAVLLDERHHHLGRQSSSAWAKYADALRRISLARFSSRFSRSSALRRSRSSLLRAARNPCSRSECRTHLRNVSAVHPYLCRNGAHRCPLRFVLLLVLKDHTHRPVPYFWGISLLRVHDSILSRIGVSGKPGAVQTDSLRHPWKTKFQGNLSLINGRTDSPWVAGNQARVE